MIVDDRDVVTEGYSSCFPREGISSTGFCPSEFREWVETAGEGDLSAVEAFLLGDCDGREMLPRMIRGRSRAPMIAMNERPALEQTLELFAAGVDDVVRKPIHVREILARVGAIRRRNESDKDADVIDDRRDAGVFGRPRSDRSRRGAAAAAARAAHPRISRRQPRQAGSPRRRYSMRSTASSTRTSRKMSSRATSASCARSFASALATIRSIPSATSATASTMI